MASRRSSSRREGEREREREGEGGVELWRRMRARLEEEVKREEGWVVEVQKGRTMAKDLYFKAWSFLGSHTAYMIGLPVLSWFGFSHFARHLTLLMGLGLMGCNLLKDLLCLPRPSSPPVVRLSDTHNLEFGFPSSHSVNAINFPLFSLYYYLYQSQGGATWGALETGAGFVVAMVVCLSICYSRIYCGMHCPLDLLGGCLVGLLLLSCWLSSLPLLDLWMTSGDNVMLYSCTLFLLFVGIYPTPTTHTPSFDDAISFGFVCVGIVVSTWRRANDPLLLPLASYPGEIAFDYARLGPLLSLIRLVVGILSILVWRAFSKKVCSLLLPPLSASLKSLFAFAPIDSQDAETERKRSALFARFNADLITKGMVYIGIGFLTSDSAAYIFDLFGVM